MLRRLLLLVPVLVLAAASPSSPARAQHRLLPVAEMRGEPALELALRKLDTVGNLMMTTAHPDDENNALLAYYGLTKGFRTSLVTATRGEGGQNEIGPELFEALAVLRTEELLAVHKFDGAEQYFTRAVDFGFSFSVEETLEKWGGQAILGDYVRMIRTIRPDVMVGFVYDGEGGGQHHQASARLSAQAFRAAADPNAFPDQIAAGLRPWQAQEVLLHGALLRRRRAAARSPARARRRCSCSPAAIPTIRSLGRTCNEIAGEARSMHKCQGMSQLLPLPGVNQGFGAGPRAYRLRDTVLPGGVNRPDPEMFDGVETALSSLAAYAGAPPPAALVAGLTRIASSVADARAAVAAKGSTAGVEPLAAGLKAVRALRADLGSLGLNDAGRYEIDVRLAQKARQFEQALVLAADVRLEAVAERRPGDCRAAGGAAGDRRQSRRRRDHRRGDAGRPHLAGRRLRAGPGRRAKARASASSPRTVPADARLTAAHFKYATDGRAVRARSRRAARAAVPPHAVRGQPGAGRRRGSA